MLIWMYYTVTVTLNQYESYRQIQRYTELIHDTHYDMLLYSNYTVSYHLQSI